MQKKHALKKAVGPGDTGKGMLMTLMSSLSLSRRSNDTPSTAMLELCA
jgi:hypothetical protein